MADADEADKTKTTPLKIPPEMRARIDAQRDKDRRGVHDELMVLLDEALTARERRK